MEVYEPINIEEDSAKVMKDESVHKQDDTSSNISAPKWLSPAEFYDQYKSSLPVKAKLSYPGQVVSSSYVSSQNFNILSTVQDDIIELQSGESAEKFYTVVKNSLVQYALLYDPNSNLQEAIKGTYFNTVESLMAQPSLPNIVYATEAHTGETAECSVAKGELFLVRKISQSRASFFKTDSFKTLSVYSVSSKRKKKLLPNCAGVFTTAPNLVKLPMTEIYNLFPALRSVKAMIFVQPNSIDIPPYLTASIVTLKPCGIGPCLRVTFPANDGKSTNTVHIPMQSPLKFRALVQCHRLPLPLPTGPTEDGKDQAHNDSPTTEYLSMQPSAFDDGPSEYEDLTIYRNAQRASQSSIRNYQSPAQLAPSADGNLAEVADTQSNCSSSGTSPPEALSSVCPAVISNDSEASELKFMVKELQRRCDKYESRMEDMGRQIECLHATHKHYAEAVSTLLHKISMQSSQQSEVQQLCSGLLGILTTNDPVAYVTHSIELHSTNRNELRGLTIAQVLKLLDAMNLSQYKEVFEKEQICGAVLSAVDDSLLELVLGIASELHRTQIMKVVSGAISIRHYGFGT